MLIVDFEKYQNTIISVECIKNEYNDEDDNYFSSIKINTSKNVFILNGIGDCCSASYIKSYKKCNFNDIIGKVITSIQEVMDEEYLSSEETDQESDDEYSIRHHIYEIKFKDNDESFRFLLLNYSNGYYDGWIEFEVIDTENVINTTLIDNELININALSIIDNDDIYS